MKLNVLLLFALLSSQLQVTYAAFTSSNLYLDDVKIKIENVYISKTIQANVKIGGGFQCAYLCWKLPRF